MYQKNNLKGSAILCLAALIWGLAFVAQSKAAQTVPPFAVNAFRSAGAVVVIFIIYKILNWKSEEKFIPKDKSERKTVLLGGLVCGIMISISANLQQIGLSAYPKGVAAEARAGFLTALYVIIVPVLSVIFHKKIHMVVWGAILLALAGVYLLCFKGGFEGIYFGDIMLLLCALSFSFHIISIDKFCDAVGGVRLSCLQFAVCTVISGIMSAIFEWGSFNLNDVLAAAPSILFLAVMSSGVAYTLQILGQRYAEPAVASITMSLESVFAALGGWVILGNKLSLREIFGCLLVFGAIISAQIPGFIKKKQ